MGQYVQSLQDSIYLGLLKIIEYCVPMLFLKIVWTNRIKLVTGDC